MKWVTPVRLIIALARLCLRFRKEPDVMYERMIAEVAAQWAHEKADDLQEGTARHDMCFVARVLTDIARGRIHKKEGGGHEVRSAIRRPLR